MMFPYILTPDIHSESNRFSRVVKLNFLYPHKLKKRFFPLTSFDAVMWN